MANKKERKQYQRFRKYLVQNGYIALQESVYIKLLLNGATFHTECGRVKEHTAEGSNVRLLPLSLMNFERMITVRGEDFDSSILISDILVF